MPLEIRSMAIRIAVLSFFAIGVVGSLVGLSPYTCCRRAVLGAVVAYIGTSAAIRVVNVILTQAMIASQINRKEYSGDRRD